ncbi:MAG: apolipoprotein N-acyltransferase [Ilumatobacteraceae bacterium]
MALSLPPWGWWPLAFVGIAVFEVALGSTPSRRRRLACGMAFGGVWLAMGTGWMWQLTGPGYGVACVVFATWHGLAELAAPTGRWRILGRPAAHTLAEAARLSFPFGGVPLASLGISQAPGPLAVVVRIGGVLLLTWLVFQVGFLLGALVERERPATADASIALLGPAIVFLVSVFAPTGSGTGRFLDVAAVQGGGEQGTSALEVPSSLVTERHLEATATIEPDEELDLVLWPENVIDVDTFAGSQELEAVAAAAARLDVPISVGVTEDVPGQPGRVVNSQFVVAPDGAVTSRYDKVRRVPFGEYVPLRGVLEALGAPVDQVRTDAIEGTGPAILDLPNGDRLAVVISWEVFFGGRVREGVREGGQAILNPTNGSSYTGTILQTQQVASSQLRALETGRWLVQASPTGFSEFVTPEGEVQQRTSVSEQIVIRQLIELRTGRTWYVTLGDRPWIAAIVVALGASWVLTVRSSRRSP